MNEVVCIGLNARCCSHCSLRHPPVVMHLTRTDEERYLEINRYTYECSACGSVKEVDINKKDGSISFTQRSRADWVLRPKYSS